MLSWHPCPSAQQYPPPGLRLHLPKSCEVINEWCLFFSTNIITNIHTEYLVVNPVFQHRLNKLRCCRYVCLALTGIAYFLFLNCNCSHQGSLNCEDNPTNWNSLTNFALLLKARQYGYSPWNYWVNLKKTHSNCEPLNKVNMIDFADYVLSNTLFLE